MKKSLIALAVMAAAGAASAQSSVTLFGTVDLNLNRSSVRDTETDPVTGTSVTVRERQTRLHRNGYNSSRLGFRGTEDLGGGMSAGFWLEGDLRADDGRAGGRTASSNITNDVKADTGFNFNRRATVQLAGGWGEFRVGRDYNPSYYNITQFDAFGTNGVGTTLLASGGQLVESGDATDGITFVRTSNQLSYFTPANLGGFYGQVAYWFGEAKRVSSSDPLVTPGTNGGDGNGWGGRIGFASGPFNVAASMSRTNDVTNTLLTAANSGDYRTWNVAGSWDFGVARALVQYSRDRHEGQGVGVGEIDGRGWGIGALVPVGAGEIRASYSTYRIEYADTLAGGFRLDDRTRKLAVGYVHNLSKRTALYGTVARSRSTGNEGIVGGANDLNTRGTATEFDLGIRHAF